MTCIALVLMTFHEGLLYGTFSEVCVHHDTAGLMCLVSEIVFGGQAENGGGTRSSFGGVVDTLE